MTSLKKITRWLLYVMAFLLVMAVISALVIRFVVFPNIDHYKDDIAAKITQIMGQKVQIGQIVTGWDGVSPHITLHQIDLFDAQSRVALHLNHVEANISWLSVPMMQPKLSQLIVHEPALTIRRAENGAIFLAGMSIVGESKPDFTNWLLKQRNVEIRNAQITWQDDKRGAPALSLQQFNFSLSKPILSKRVLKSLLGQHVFSLSALPSVGSAQAITANGYFVGKDITKLNNWYGEVNTLFKQTDLAAFKPWLDYPLNIQSGYGSAQIQVSFAKQLVKSVKAQAKLNNVQLIVSNPAKPFVAQHFSGDIDWLNGQQTQKISAENIQLTTNTGLNIQKGKASYSRTLKQNKPWIKADIALDQLDLSALKQTVAQIATLNLIPPKTMAQLDGFAPAGQLQAVELSWQGRPEHIAQYQIQTQFKQLGIQAFNKIPGFSNLNGKIQADETGGKLNLTTQNATLNLKDILRWPVPVSTLNGEISWLLNAQNSTINVKNLYVSNPHITGTVNAQYHPSGNKAGYLDLTGKFSKGNAKYALLYYPISLGKDALNWLDTSILAGNIDDATVVLKGNLSKFPFVNSKNQPDASVGIFNADAKLSNVLMEYGTGWPVLDNLNSTLHFEGSGIKIKSTAGRISGKKILNSYAEIAQLDADWPILHIVSEAEGLVTDGIKFINESPVKQVTLGFTDDLKTAGRGNLKLTLDIPLQDSEKTVYKGIYKVSNGTIFANPEIGLPELSKLNGSLSFNENGLTGNNISTEVLGGPAQFSLSTGANKAIKIIANGKITDAGIKKLSTNPISKQLSGSANWVGEINIKKPLLDASFRSNLVGLALNLPAPLKKVANQEMLLTVEKKQASINNDHFSVNLGRILSAKVQRNLRADQLVIDRGDIGINVAAVMPLQPGLSVHGKLDELDADEWLALWEQQASQSNELKADELTMHIADLSIRKLTIFDRPIHAIKVSGQPTAAGLQMQIDAQEMAGNVEWQSAENGKLIARLKRLSIPSSLTESTKFESTKPIIKKEFRKQANAYPALDIVADSFELISSNDNAKEVSVKKLGALTLNAFENGEDWVIQKLTINNADSTLGIQGNWHNWARNPNTSLIISLSTNNIGKTFNRFGQPDTIKGGEARLNGQLNWAGSPHEFDITRLNGNLTIEANKGQVLKVQPGVGRLLGLVTLQSLPRRLSLDFRDLFSDGFAFDKISATAKIDNGIVYSDDFFMTGPAAEARIKGETNLKAETQYLKVKVTPHVSDSLSLAALVGGPIVGAAAFVAQKILKDPFNKIASTEYVITGTWDKPLEVKSDKDDAQKPSNESPLTQ